MSRSLRRMRSLAVVPFAWLGIALALALFPWMPRRMLFLCCDLLSGVLYACDRRGRRQALGNLRVFTGRQTDIGKILLFNADRSAYDPTPRERKIVRRAYRNMARTVGYAFWTFVRARRRCAETGIMDARAKDFLARNRPAVTVSGHVGCWEILSQLALLEGHRMMSVAKDIGTAGMTALLMRARRSIGQEIVSAEGAFRTLMTGIREGKSLGLLVDQGVNPKKGGVWIRFFGCPMPVSAAPAFFAAKAKAPIIVAWSRPLRGGRYRCECLDTIGADEARDVWATTQRCARDLEGVFRRHPSCCALNYDYFGHVPTKEEYEALLAREAKAR